VSLLQMSFLMFSCSPKYNYQRLASGDYVFQKSTAKVLAIRQNKAFVQTANAGDGGSEVFVVVMVFASMS
jgi:hypothetical protein